MADKDQHGSAAAAKEQAAKEQLARDAEIRKKQGEQRDAVMKGKPTPTQEENDLAKLGVPFDSHEPDGSPQDPPEQTKQVEAHPAGANRPYQTRQSTAAPTPPKP